MKNIWGIFTCDLRNLLKNFFVLVIAGGLIVLPALYAWFNIYANWDPYANTGNIAIAVVNLDDGFFDDNANYLTMGRDICDELKEKDSIGWVFLDDKNEAVSKVKSGDVYAAIVIEEGFSKGMVNGVIEGEHAPAITYYVNDKKNAVATKITDSAVSSVQTSINKSYIRVLAENVFEDGNEISKDLEEDDYYDKILVKLESLSDTLDKYTTMIDGFIESNDELKSKVAKAAVKTEESVDKINDSRDDLDETRKELETSKDSFADFSKEVDSTLKAVSDSLNNMNQSLMDASLEEDVKTIRTDMSKIVTDAADTSEKLTELSDAIKKAEGDSESLAGTVTTLKDMKALSDAIASSMNTNAGKVTEETIKSVQKSITSYATTVDEMTKMYDEDVVPQVNTMLSGMQKALKSTDKILSSLGKSATSMGGVFDGVDTTVDALDVSLVQLKDIIKSSNLKLKDSIKSIKDMSESEKAEAIISILGGDADVLAEFFSEPVLVQETYIYEIANYGSGVAPFYTTLALWVGMTILVSLIKVNADTKKMGLKDVKPSEQFFGRYLIFFLLSQLQAAVIVLGDLYFFKIQCLYPFRFWLISAVASFVFSLLIYALTISFGDIGKAVAVVVMVIQIAGSSGTYPIEALPDFFQAVYIFLPFPYAINGMRECIGGMYDNVYSLCIAELLIFAIASLVIGLLIRVPFMKVNHFMEKRMEDTQMM